MASAAAAPRPPSPAPAPPPPPPPPAAAVQWLGPRVSFSLDDAGGGGGREAGAAGPNAGADFEFLLGGCAAACSMLPADELFSGGKLVPLRIPAPADETGAPGVEAEEVTARSMLLLPRQEPQAPAPAQQLPETQRAEAAAAAAKGVVVGGVEPKIPARRWRDLLRLRKQQAASSGAAAEPRALRRLLRRGPKPPEPEPSLSLPLLREPGAEEPDTTKAADKTAAAPAAAPAPPPSSSQHQGLLPPKIRMSASQQQQASASASASATTSQSQSEPPAPPPPPPPPPPSAVAADSPRLNAAGKVVFNGLGRSSSSPSSLAGGRRHRNAGPGGSGAMERSYSAHVRVAPVLNVPVCSLRGSRKSVSVFGIDRLFSPSGAASASSSSSSAAGAARKNKAAKKDVAPAGAGAQ